MYRKLWSEAIIVVLVMVLIGLVEQNIYARLGTGVETQFTIMLVSAIVFGVIYGSVGNYLYLSKADREIRQVLSTTSDEEERLFLLSQTGGISWIPFMLAGIFLVFIVLSGPR